MDVILVVGAGSFASEDEQILILSRYDSIAFIDDYPEKARCIPVVGKISELAVQERHMIQQFLLSAIMNCALNI